MLSINEIKKYYPENLHRHERFILREYLQYKILEIIFDGPFAEKLVFLGGSCLRIVHDNQRFSEDIYFDNFHLSSNDFSVITGHLKKNLELLGYETEIRNVDKAAYHCYLKFPGLLFKEGLTQYKEEKILIQLDTEAHDYFYTPDQPILNKFDVFTQINTTPASILLSQKFYALINRKRNKGRDFFDIVFLLGNGIKPDYNYLDVKLEIDSPDSLKNAVLKKCDHLDMNAMAKDVRPFLFNPADEKRIRLFAQYIKEAKL